MTLHWDVASGLDAEGEPFVVITLIEARGHVPQEPGAKAIVTADGLRFGTVGGGRVEARAIEHAQALLREKASEPRLVTWNLQREIGMSCGGEATFLFETHDRKRWQVAIFGAGHVGQALVRALLPLDCRITCLDTREEWLAKLPTATNLEAVLEPDLPARVRTLDPSTFFVVMTKGHATDVPILETIFRCFPDAPYVGVMGSELKSQKIRADLVSRDISPACIERLHCPIGIDAGGNVPAEIAISVACQLLSHRVPGSKSLSR